MRGLLVICPSRGRPQAAAELAEAITATATTRVSLVVCVDDDDPQRDAYVDLVGGPLEWLQHGPRTGIGPVLDRVASVWARRYRAVAFLGDDHRPRTKGWDANLLHALDQFSTPGIAYGNDLMQGRNLPTAVAMDSRIVQALGRMTPPGVIHLYLDNYWRDLGHELGSLVYLEDTIIEHLHPQAGKAEWDDGYREVNSGATWERDGAAYDTFVKTGGIQQDADAVRRYVRGV